MWWRYLRFVTFITSAILGALLAILVVTPKHYVPEKSTPTPPSLLMSYELWAKSIPIHRRQISADEARYSLQSPLLEAHLLRQLVPVMCVLLAHDDRYVQAANHTWSNSCEKFIIIPWGRGVHKPASPSAPAIGPPINSSFHMLCETIRNVSKHIDKIEWVLFVKDDTFAIVENLRHTVAPLNSSQGYYLGHAVNFWGVDYNVMNAGFVLSRGAIYALIDKFNDTQSCISGGKYWKQEDYYLGKHLKDLNIFPIDTRDEKGYTSFLGFDLDKVMFPNSIQHLSNYYTRALYPVKCCSGNTITFQVLSFTEIYRYYYMTYTLQIFLGGSHGNKLASTPKPDDVVWQEFLQESGLPINISAREYEEIWYIKFDNATAFPGVKKV